MSVLLVAISAGTFAFFYYRNQSIQNHPKASKILVGYWKIRGLGAPLRMMCEFAGAPYESVEYSVTGTPGNWDRSSWFSVKAGFLAKNPLANLPYVQDGDVVVTQSNACLTYLGRKFGLNGKDDKELTKMEQILAEVFDLRNALMDVVYNTGGVEKDLVDHLGTAVKHLTKLEECFKFNNTLFSVTSDKPLTADFHLWEMLDQHELLSQHLKRGSLVGKFERLKRFYDTFRALPQLKKYFEGDLYKFPVNNITAIWK